MITVIVASMAVTAKMIQPYINNIKNLNQQEYLKEIADYILLNPGSPRNWGSNKSLAPEIFGLAKNGSLYPYELDIDKVCRLNPENAYHLDYLAILESLKTKKVAIRVSIQQIMDVSIAPVSNESIDNLTNYTFRIMVEKDGFPILASLHCYIIAKNFVSAVSADTSSNGEATISFEIPNNSNGTALMVVFARNKLNSGITSYAVYSFGHLSQNPPPNRSFVELSPLNYTLHINKLYVNETLLEVYALTYNYNKTLSASSNTTYTIPKFLDKSPIVLVVTGSNSSTFFAEWTVYPQVPLEIGANLQYSQIAAFSYIVSINQVFYKVRIQCEGANE